MKNLSTKLEEVSLDEISEINGGGFAYDVGFFLRALVLAGPGPASGAFIVMEYAVNYRPVN